MDHVEALDAGGQIALFNAFNRKEGRGRAAPHRSPATPLHLSCGRTWAPAWAPVSSTACNLSDPEKAAALATQARERALKLSPGYRLSAAPRPRDMPAPSPAFVVAPDRCTLEHKRAVTLPLLRGTVAAGGGTALS